MNGIRHHLKWIILINACIYVLVLCICFSDRAQLNDTDTVIGIFSVIISIISGAVAYIACFSIDAVKMITNMDGNVLENENYSIVYENTLEKLNEVEEIGEYIEALGKIISKKRRIKDCVEFSMYIQHFIDSIIWLNFYNDDSGLVNDYSIEYKSKKKIISLVKKAKKYEKVNSGLENIFDENIKLIISVLRTHLGNSFLRTGQNKTNVFLRTYNKYKYYNRYLMTKNKKYVVSIYNVCGAIFSNPITQIVYYNYLGTNFIETVLGESIHKSHALCLERMCTIFDQKDEDKERKEILLRKAAENLKYAQEKSEKNMLWNCICSENLIKVQIVEWLISGAQINKRIKIHKKIEEAKAKWGVAYCILEKVGDVDEKSYIMKEIQKRKQALNNISKNIKTFMKLKQS